MSTNNLDVIDAWRAWVRETDAAPGDTYPSEDSSVHVWFEGDQANEYFHCFASTDGGSLLAIWSREGGAFEDAPVVFLGGEGDLHVLGDDVLQALALVARAGAESLDAVLQDGEEEDDADEDLSAWLEEEYDIGVPESVEKAVKRATKRHPGLPEFVNDLTGI
jgi:hypothetical protein